MTQTGTAGGATIVDVVVVGLGVGGEAVAGELASAGLDVVGVESRLVGGECPYWACVPTKMMVRAAGLLADGRRIPGLAGDAEVTADWTAVADRIRDEATDDWDDTAAVERFTGKGGHFVRGEARLAGPGRVTVGDRTFEGRRGVVLATGTAPATPPVDGLEDTPYWTNRDAVAVTSLPESLVVLGGGAVGVELAQVFARFGVAVTIVENTDRLLAVEEPEASQVVEDVFAREGIEVVTGTEVTKVAHEDSGFVLTSPGREVRAERLLVATGRRPNLQGIGLESVGLDPSVPSLEVDGHLRAGDRLWALGDITGRGAFTHVAMYQSQIVVRDVLGRPGPAADYRALPRVSFSDPEVASVGLTERQAREQGLTVRTGTSQVSASTRGWIHKAGNDGFIKLVVDADTGLLVGATSVGPAGGEVLGALAVAIHGRVPVERLRHMIYAYPTFHRGIEDALRQLDR